MPSTPRHRTCTPPPALQRHPDGRFFVRQGARWRTLGHDPDKAQRAYQRWCTHWNIAGGRWPLDRDNEMTVAMVVAEVWPTIEREVGGTPNLARYKAAAKRLLAFHADCRIEDLTKADIGTLRQAMLDEDLKASYVSQIIATIARLLRLGEEIGVVPDGHADRIGKLRVLRRPKRSDGTPARPSKAIETVPEEDFEATMHHLPSNLEALCRLLRLTAARPSELTDLRPCDLVFTEEDVAIRYLDEHKTAQKGRKAIVLGPRAIDLLRPLLIGRALTAYVFSPAEAFQERRERARSGPGRRPNQKPNPRKTARTFRPHYDSNALRQAVHTACDKAGVPRWSPYNLRATRLTEAQRLASAELAQAMAGHTSLTTTQQHYLLRNLPAVIEFQRATG